MIVRPLVDDEGALVDARLPLHRLGQTGTYLVAWLDNVAKPPGDVNAVRISSDGRLLDLFSRPIRLGRFAGNWLRAALIAACTSRAAASMLRFKSNCNTMLVEPSWLVEVI